MDDDGEFCESSQSILAGEGYEVETATTAEDALKKVENKEYDVMLLDLQIGDFDGMRLLERVKALQLDADVVIVTGHSSLDTATRALRYGATDYLEKPIQPGKLTTTITRILRRRATAAMEPPTIPEIRMQVANFDSKASPVVAEALSRDVGTKKATASTYQLAVLGMFAGAYIAFGAALATLVGHDIPKYLGVGIAQMLTGAVFSVGLMLVVIAGAELFTGNNLMLISALDRRVSWATLLAKWALVFAANFAGALLLVGIMYGSGLWRAGVDYGVAKKALAIANVKVNLSLPEALLRGIACNWLVCLAVWMAMAARQVACKILAILFPIMAFVALGYEHSVANMYFVPLGIVLRHTEAAAQFGADLSNLCWSRFLLHNLLPVTIGNIIGGAGLVAFLYWSVYLKKAPAD
ncbi:MAG: formate/nitrite transporter family protein [Kiritimatiellae bacterium]|nr:formate/nitrite transporter family protein [Kiritimatiellia bacterium]